MTALFRRLPRWLGLGALVLALNFCPGVAPMLRAQPPEEAAPEGGESKGRPLDGYLGTIVLVMLALFIVGKSARR
jgi:hypothetical protein